MSSFYRLFEILIHHDLENFIPYLMILEIVSVHLPSVQIFLLLYEYYIGFLPCVVASCALVIDLSMLSVIRVLMVRLFYVSYARLSLRLFLRMYFMYAQHSFAIAFRYVNFGLDLNYRMLGSLE